MAKLNKKKSHKNITKSKGFKLAIGISAAVVAIGAVCGLAVGLCATSKTKYVDLNPFTADTSNRSYYYTDGVTKDATAWNVPDTQEPYAADTAMRSAGVCYATHNYNYDPATRFKFVETIGNGPDTSILDKSFQQSAYYAQSYWVHTQDTQLNGGTNWAFKYPAFDYTKFPLDSLTLTNSNDITLGQFSSSAQKPSGSSNTDFVNTYIAAQSIGKRALVFPGYQHITPLSILKQNNPTVYNAMGYILIDSEVADASIASVQFKAEQSAFLSGVAACQYLEENWEDVYSKVNGGQLAMGCFGGQNIITVTCFMGGLQLGIWFYNNYILPNTDFYKNASEEEREKRTVKFISLGKESSYFSGTFVIGDAKLLAQELLARGACCVMAVAGPQTGDVVSEIVAQKSPCRVLGVDSAMEDGDWGQYYSKSDLFKEKTKVVLCSAEKNVGQLTVQVLDNMWCRNRATYPLEADEGEETRQFKDLLKSVQMIFTTNGTAASGAVTYTVKYGADETSAKEVPSNQIEDGVWTVNPDYVPADNDFIYISGTDGTTTWKSTIKNGSSSGVQTSNLTWMLNPSNTDTIKCEILSDNKDPLVRTQEANDGDTLNFAVYAGEILDDLGEDSFSRMGAVGTVGYTSIGNLYNEGVKLSNAGQEYLVRALVNINDAKWQDIKSYADAISLIINQNLPAITTLDGKEIEPMNTLDFINTHRYFKY